MSKKKQNKKAGQHKQKIKLATVIKSSKDQIVQQNNGNAGKQGILPCFLYFFYVCRLLYSIALIQVGLIFQNTNRLSEWDGGVLQENTAIRGNHRSYSNPHIHNDCGQ